MSAWSDYKCGTITENEYNSICRREAAIDRDAMKEDIFAKCRKCADFEIYKGDDGTCAYCLKGIKIGEEKCNLQMMIN